MKQKISFVFILSFFFLVPAPEAMTNQKIPLFKMNETEYQLKRGATESILRYNPASPQREVYNWGKISTIYQSLPFWSDEVMLKFYVLLFQDEKKLKKTDAKFVSYEDFFTLLEGNVTYKNIPQGDSHRGEMYLHPYSLQRYGEVVEIRIELWYQGHMEAFTQKSLASRKIKKVIQDQWWKQFKTIESELLNRYHTPFVHESDNSIAAIKMD